MELSIETSSLSWSEQDMELSPNMSEPLNLTIINDDCKELIFEYLEWQDLIHLNESWSCFPSKI